MNKLLPAAPTTSSIVPSMSRDITPPIAGQDAEDTKLLAGMAAEARRYIESHEWCPPIRR